ncbi:hypothetical protein SDC9_148695 [bioreactor metagenome]|uniref:Uncharacterized protein n=1 Tax=bioreactor metagenome TaxID=1076179 RepID=A0A645EJ61_9ZZZZ
MVLEDLRFHDRVHGTTFFTEAAEDALGQVDVIARGTARPIGANVGFDGDGHRRAHGFAELASNAALLAVIVATQRVQPPKTRRQRRLLLGVIHGDLAREGVASRQGHALGQFPEHEALKEVLDREGRCNSSRHSSSPLISRCSTASAAKHPR